MQGSVLKALKYQELIPDLFSRPNSQGGFRYNFLLITQKFLHKKLVF
jgi:hypothetical protein